MVTRPTGEKKKPLDLADDAAPPRTRAKNRRTNRKKEKENGQRADDRSEQQTTIPSLLSSPGVTWGGRKFGSTLGGKAEKIWK